MLLRTPSENKIKNMNHLTSSYRRSVVHFGSCQQYCKQYSQHLHLSKNSLTIFLMTFFIFEANSKKLQKGTKNSKSKSKLNQMSKKKKKAKTRIGGKMAKATDPCMASTHRHHRNTKLSKDQFLFLLHLRHERKEIISEERVTM